MITIKNRLPIQVKALYVLQNKDECSAQRVDITITTAHLTA
jgi:hypothetical protein